ncbi:zinc finger BED domain-containing protein RICESLEEPER 2-like protein [Tanacetum coccineum]
MLVVVTCAAALNPILNRGGVETLINNNAYDLGLTDEDPSYVSHQIARFNANFDNIFQVYLDKYGSSGSNIHAMYQEAGLSSRDPDVSFYNLLVSESRKRARGNTPSSELRRYGAFIFLEQMSIQEFHNLDILASESAFSVSRRVISPCRSKLTPTSVEFCICLKDHLDGIERTQHISPLEGELNGLEEQIHDEEIAAGVAEPIYEDEVNQEQ